MSTMYPDEPLPRRRPKTASIDDDYDPAPGFGAPPRPQVAEPSSSLRRPRPVAARPGVGVPLASAGAPGGGVAAPLASAAAGWSPSGTFSDDAGIVSPLAMPRVAQPGVAGAAGAPGAAASRPGLPAIHNTQTQVGQVREDDRQRMYRNNTPGLAAAGIRVPGVTDDAGPLPRRAPTAAGAAGATLLNNARRLVNAETGGMANSLPGTMQETMRLMDSSDPVTRGAMGDALDTRDRLAQSEQMTESGMDPISYRAAQQVARAQGQMSAAGVTGDTMRNAGLLGGPQPLRSGGNYTQGGVGYQAPVRVVADSKATGVPGAADITQDEVIAFMGRNRGADGRNKFTFQQATQELINQRKEAAATSATLATAGQPANAKGTLRTLLASADEGTRLKAATALIDAEKPPTMKDDRWQRIQGWARIAAADSARDPVTGEVKVGEDGKAAVKKMKDLMDQWEAEGSAGTKDSPKKITTQAEYDALPKGAYFIDPGDGKAYIK